jgi:hypothetical protein
MRKRCVRDTRQGLRRSDRGRRHPAALTPPRVSARNSNADIFGFADAESRLCVWLRRVHLIKFFVVALLEIDDRPVARPADLDHREAVGGRIRQRDNAVQKAGGRHLGVDAIAQVSRETCREVVAFLEGLENHHRQPPGQGSGAIDEYDERR